MKKRFFALLLALVMLVGLLPTVTLPSFAATYGTVSVNGGAATSYTSVSSLISAINKKNGTFVVHMYSDWDLKANNSNDRITVNGSADITIHMHGHVISRGLTSKESYGNVFIMESGGALTLIGSEDSTEAETTHTVYGYNSSGSRFQLTGDDAITGGVVTGAYFDGGECGAFYLKGNNTVTLQNVAVVGNRNGSSRYGGGMRVGGDGCTINMENSRICYNYSGQHGGGIRVDTGSVTSTYYCTINMENSSIDHNYAGYNGGGIQADGVVTLTGDGNSYIAWNECGGHANSNNVGGGGGIDCYYGGSVVKNLIIENNKTNSYQGGGICCEGEKGTTISGCTIRYNRANGSTYGYGGGVYLKHDSNSLADCDIYGNEANSRANGDGVYLRTGNLYLGGYLEIKNNGVMTRNASGVVTSDTPATEGTNLYLASGAYITPSLNNTSDIHMTVADPSTSRKLSDGAGTYYPYCYSYDEVSSGAISHPATPTYGFRWYNEDPADSKYRYLYLVGHNVAVAALPTLTAVEAPDSVAELSNLTVDGTQYKQIKTWYTAPSGTQALQDSDAVCFYSDGYFFRDRNVYNEQLSTMSFALTMAGFYANLGTAGTVLGGETLTDSVYYNKHAHVRQLLANIGCEDESIYVNNFNRVEPGMDSIGVAIAHKELLDASGSSTGKILVPVVIRSSGYGAEWASNFSMGDGSETAGGELLGFAMAANMAYSDVVDYITAYDLTADAQAGNLIFWIVGYSRGGATANLTAKRLLAGSSPEIDISSILGNTDTDFTRYLKSGTTDTMASRSFSLGDNQVVCYTFEAAQGGTDAAQTAANLTIDDLKCVHNVVNAADVVPMVGTSAMGFKRYGVDHYVPGTAAGTVVAGGQVVETDFTNGTLAIQAVSGVTSYCDNDPIYLDTAANSAYMNLRAKMVKHFLAVNPYSVFDDYFRAAKISWVRGNLPIFSEPFNGTTSANLKLEGYLTDLVTKMQDWKIASRSWYTTVLSLTDSGTTYTYDSFQNAIRDAVDVFFGMSPEKTSEAINDLKAVLNGIGIFGDYINAGDLWNLYNDVLSNWPNLSDSRKIYYFDWTWGIVEKTGALSVFTDAQIAELEAAWPTIADVLFTLLYSDKENSAYGTSDVNQRFGTLLYNYSRILTNHYGETVMAWLRASDTNYDGEISGTVKRYAITQPAAADLALSAAAVGETGGTIAASAGATTTVYDNELRLELNAAAVQGEAIYYSVDSGATWNLYQKDVAIDLHAGTGESRALNDSVTVQAYAISYGQRGATASFTLRQGTPPQEVYHDDGDTGFFTYSSGWGTDSSADHTEGTAHTINVASMDMTKTVSFPVTGTGYRVYTDTSNRCGTVLVTRTWTESGVAHTVRKVVVLYRGYSYSNGTWTPVGAADYADTVYHQVPAICEDGLDAGIEYTVTLTPYYTELYDETDRGSYDFVLDGVTVINPAGCTETNQYRDLRDTLPASGTLASLDVDGPYVFVNLNRSNLPTYTSNGVNWLDGNAQIRVYFYNENDSSNNHAWSGAPIPTNDPDVYAFRKPVNNQTSADSLGDCWTHMIVARVSPGFDATASNPWSERWDQTGDLWLGNGNYVSQISLGNENGNSNNRSATQSFMVDNSALYVETRLISWWGNGNAIPAIEFNDGGSNTVRVAGTAVDGSTSLFKVTVPTGHTWTRIKVMRVNPNNTSGDPWNWDNGYQSYSANQNLLVANVTNDHIYVDYTRTYAHVTVSGGALVDGMGTVTNVADLKTYGPKNLLLLGSHQALVFTVATNDASLPAIGAKAIHGTDCGVAVYTMDGTTLTQLLDRTITNYEDNYNDSYYALSGVSSLNGKTVVIYNKGSDPIALSRLRWTNNTSLTLTFNTDQVFRAASMLRALEDGTLEPIVPEEPTAFGFVGNSLTLDGDIGVNFYVGLGEADPATAAVQFSRGGVSAYVPLEDLEPEANGTYKLTVRVAAKEMTDRIHAVLLIDGETAAEQNYSVATYALRVIANADGVLDRLQNLPELQALCRAMLIYGAKAQSYFDYHVERLADAQLEDASLAPIPTETAEAFGKNELPDLTAYGLTFYGASLLLRTETIYRLYFEAADPEALESFRALRGDEALKQGFNDDGLFYVDVEGIAAKALMDDIPLRFGTTDGAQFTETASGTFRVGAYLRRALGGSDEKLADTVTALYRYYEAAAAYFAD